MADLAPTLAKKEFKNWVKGALALLFTKDALTDFVSAEVDRHHQRLLQLVPAANLHNTCNCKINSLPQCTRSRNHSHIVTGPRQLCSRGVCNILMDVICRDHRFRGPSWKNTDPQKWCTDAYDVAKCYMAPDGYSHNTSLSETDFNGIVSVIINNLSFSTQIQDNLATEPNVCTKARKVGREIRHTADHLLSDSDLRDYIDDLINLLCDPTCLLNDPSAQDAVRKLRMLKTNDLTIHEKDITEALKDNIRDTFTDEHKDLLQKINNHYNKLQTDSVAEIDRIVAVRKTELEELANKLTDDITRHAELKKHEIDKHGETKETKEFEEKLKETFSHMDAPMSIVLVPAADFPRVDAIVTARGMDVVTLQVAGLPGFGFWESRERNEVVQFLLDNFVDFRLLRDCTPIGARHPPPAPHTSPEDPRGEPDGASRTL